MAGFHAGPPSWFNWNLEMLVFKEQGKTGEPKEKPLEQGVRTNNELNRHMAPRRNQMWATLLVVSALATMPFPIPRLSELIMESTNNGTK